MIYGLILSLFVVLASFIYFMIQFRRNTLALFLSIPCMLGAIVYGHYTYQKLLGYPTTNLVENSSRLVSFFSKDKKEIYIWVVEPGETVPRAHIIPYTKKGRKRLNSMRRKLRKGDVIIIKFPNSELHPGAFMLYKMPIPKWLEKDANQ